MKEIRLKEKPALECIKQIKIEKKIIGSIRQHKGHILFEFNKVNYQLTKAKFKPLSFPMAANNKATTIRNSVDVKEHCYYISCLNYENAIKKLTKLFNPEFIAVLEDE